MRVLCRHGHFAFYPKRASDIAEFASRYGFTLEPEEDYYTFSALAGAPKYSLLGNIYLNLPAIKTYEGTPWEVMKQNSFVYSLTTGLIVPKLAVVQIVELHSLGLHYIFDGAILQPGSRTLLGGQILSYSGEVLTDKFQMRVSEFSYE